jgi:N-acetylglucosamine kinase-like BadF-type ATPase
MFNTNGQWVHLETYDEFDNGLSDLIEFWVSEDATATQALKDAALAHFKADLESATINWAENKAKSKKYAAIAQELAEFEEALKQG